MVGQWEERVAVRVISRGRSRPAQWRSLEKSRPVALNGDSFFVGGETTALRIENPLPAELFAVADGLGGEGNDDVASQTAVKGLEAIFRGEAPLEDFVLTSPDAWLRAAFYQVNRGVCEVRRSRRLRGVYTTLTSALLVHERDGSVVLYPANVGDSRMYLLRNRQLQSLTRDDGENGFISRVIGDPNVFAESYLRYTTTVARTDVIESKILTALEGAMRDLVQDMAPDDALPLASLFLTLLEGICPVDLAPAYSRPLGILFEGLGARRFKELVNALAQTYEKVAAAMAPIPLLPGDRLLLCSDGISNAFSHTFIQEVMAMDSTGAGDDVLDTILSWLTESPGRVDDDRTAVVVRLEQVDP
jgi:serine/threonine protein phosphatase PrpC